MNTHNGGDETGPNDPQVGEDLADVLAAAAEHGRDRVALRSLQRTPRQTAILFHVPDLGLDGTPVPYVGASFGVTLRRWLPIRILAVVTWCPR